MTNSRSFIKFALFFCITLPLAILVTACKGRTADNMQPTGDTVEVVIMQTTNEANLTE